MSRRRLFGWLAKAAGAAVLAACTTEHGDGNAPDAATTATDAGSGSGSTTSDASTGSDTCSVIPEETSGPYPGDGTNGVNALTLSGIVRSDIRPSLSSSLVATGVQLTLTLSLVDAATCAPVAGYAVYIWHCDQDGNYSMYAQSLLDETYLRGVQVTDASGQVTFTTIFPACYSGRWPHIHIEVYETLAQATTGANAIAITQLAMPAAVCDVVYASSGYSASVANLGQVSLATDMVFSDGATLETPVVTGSVAAGYVATNLIAVTP